MALLKVLEKYKTKIMEHKDVYNVDAEYNFEKGKPADKLAIRIPPLFFSRDAG